MKFKPHIAGKVILGLTAIAALGGVVMLLWNAVAPALFLSAQPIDYLHAVGLLALCRILFGGFRGHGHHGGWHGRQHGGQHLRQHWEKWQSMTAEEREQFKQNGPWAKRPDAW